MTKRERLLAVLHGRLPDRVPCCPDISNMVPARLTGKPFWDIYAYQDPPLWKAYIDAIKHFDIDGGFELLLPPEADPIEPPPAKPEEYVVHRYADGSFATQKFFPNTQQWRDRITVYTADNPPRDTAPVNLDLPSVPDAPEPLDGAKSWPHGPELWQLIRNELGEHGVIGMKSGMGTALINSPEAIYAYYDDPAPFYEKAEKMQENVERRINKIATMDSKPDFLFCGGSGTLVFQTPDMFRELVLPVLKKTTRLAADIGIPTHVHSCGPETELVQMAAEETDLTIIDPLEVPPMGDCDLADLKKRYGNRLALKGNLHTTDVMLRGTAGEVAEASHTAIDEAGTGGGFILSTGDQCGRDTPDENLHAMVEAAREYGKY